MPLRTRFQNLLALLAKEKAVIESQLGKIDDAIAALQGAGQTYKRRQQIRKVKAVARKVRAMSAAQKAAVSKRMKAYWAAKRRSR